MNSHFGSFLSLLSDFLFSELSWKGSLSHFGQQSISASALENLRKTISCVYSQLLYCMALRKNHGARRNGRERVVSGNNLIKAFLSSIPLFSVRRPLYKEEESMHGGRVWEGERINRRHCWTLVLLMISFLCCIIMSFSSDSFYFLKNIFYLLFIYLALWVLIGAHGSSVSVVACRSFTCGALLAACKLLVATCGI